MFAEVIDVASFKSIFNKMEKIFENVIFECDSKGIRFSTLDKSHTVFMFVELDGDYFWEYECEEPDKFSVELSELRKVLKSVKNKLTIETTSEEVILKSEHKKFTLLQSVIDYADPLTPPTVPYDYSVVLPFKWIKETSKDISTFAKDFWVETKGNDIFFKTDGQIGKFENYYSTLKELEPTETKLALEKLDVCLGTDKISDEIKICGGNSKPISLELENTGVNIKYMIAPIIEMD